MTITTVEQWNSGHSALTLDDSLLRYHTCVEGHTGPEHKKSPQAGAQLHVHWCNCCNIARSTWALLLTSRTAVMPPILTPRWDQDTLILAANKLLGCCTW